MQLLERVRRKLQERLARAYAPSRRPGGSLPRAPRSLAGVELLLREDEIRSVAEGDPAGGSKIGLDFAAALGSGKEERPGKHRSPDRLS